MCEHSNNANHDLSTKDAEERIRESGQATLGGTKNGKIHLLSVIGEIEGHENLSGSTKTTKY
ncbi:MAG: Clp protease, partial [Lachnospiraceae bacterium]|nr:Clp protease [Lachnospiraceae bacterium]